MSVTWEPIDAPTGEPDAGSPVATSTAPPRSRLARIFLGSDHDPRWARPALIALLIATGLLYIVDLSASGYANSFYAAAVEAGTKSWKAMLFGSFDSSNFITVDKPPASLWVMEIFGRIFGFGSWSLLLPQALEGVATVGILYAAVKRRFGASAGLIAGAMLAVTPVAALMFRFDNPDALLVLLMTVATYAVIRALEVPATRAATRWLIGAGVAIGFAFLTKTLQAFLVVPSLGAVYLLFADTSLRRRIFQLAASLAALVLSAGWWLALVSLWPAGSRPYIGGSQDNSEWNLIFGYNGFGRLTGNETGSVGGHASTTGGGMWGTTGITRLLGADMGSQISWLLPTALLAAVALVWLYRRSRRTDTARAQVLLWLGWLVVTALTFSFAKGIIHPYYTVALAPPIAALVGIGAVELWRLRGLIHARIAMAGLLLVTTGWSYELLDRAPSWHPWIRGVVLFFGIAASLAILVLPTLRQRIIGLVVASAALVAMFIGPAAYAVDTAANPHTGSIPSAGPSSTNSDLFSSGGGNAFGGGHGGFGGGGRPGGFGGRGGFSRAGGGFPGGGSGFAGGPPTGSSTGGFPGGSAGATRGGFGGGTNAGGFGGGAAGGLLNSGTVSSQLADLLKADASSYTWVAAAVGSNSAAGFQLATDEPVMAIGGFNGTDPAPSLATFEKYVSEGKIHYFIGSGGGGFGGSQQGGSSDSSQIATWVADHFTAKTVDGTTIYDLTSPNS